MLKLSKLPNGLVLIIEEMRHVKSAAYELFLPGGVMHDPAELQGASLLLAELTCRGAGTYDSRALSDRFDALGVKHSEGAGHDKFVYRGSLLSEKLGDALELVACMVRQPRLPEEEIESIRSLLVQDIRSLEDNPAGKAMVVLNEQYYPAPYGRSSLGTLAGLEATDAAALRTEWERLYRPEGAVLSIAGNVCAAEVEELALKYFGQGWEGRGAARPPFGAMPAHTAQHVESDSAQLQIAMAFPSAPFGAEDYYAAKTAVGILSGGMFGRLFIEVREKLGLCYSVYARHIGTKEYGTILAYAGTTPERAHQTLEVMERELRSVRGTVSAEELERAKANILAACIIGEESASSRAGSNAGDWWVDGRVRTLDEISERINKVTLQDIDRYCERYPLQSYMLVTLGPRRIDQAGQSG